MSEQIAIRCGILTHGIADEPLNDAAILIKHQYLTKHRQLS